MLTVRVAFKVSEVGLTEAVTVTWTERESGANPVAVALMLTVPIAIPVTCGFVAATCAPAGTKTLAVMVAMVVSLLAKLTVTPPGGAGVERLNARLLVCPGATTRLVARLMRLLVTLTPVVAVG
jgi:hypothetical protein